MSYRKIFIGLLLLGSTVVRPMDQHARATEGAAAAARGSAGDQELVATLGRFVVEFGNHMRDANVGTAAEEVLIRELKKLERLVREKSDAESVDAQKVLLGEMFRTMFKVPDLTGMRKDEELLGLARLILRLTGEVGDARVKQEIASAAYNRAIQVSGDELALNEEHCEMLREIAAFQLDRRQNPRCNNW